MMHARLRLWWLLLAWLVLPGAQRAAAQEIDPPPSVEPGQPFDRPEAVSDVVGQHNRGVRFSMTPGLLIPPRGGPLRFAFGADLRYGVVMRKVIVAPGIRLGAILLSKPRVYTSYATLRITFPWGRFGPYMIGGVGGGYTDRPSPGVMGGGGILFHRDRFAVGVEATFHNLINTPYQVLAIGPQLLFVF